MAESGGEFIKPPSNPKPEAPPPKAERSTQRNHTPLDVEKLRIDNVRAKLNTFLEKRDRKRAKKVVAKKGKLLTNPMARANVIGLHEPATEEVVENGVRVIRKKLGKLIDDWQPTTESGLPSVSGLIPSETLLQEIKNGEKVTDPGTGQQFNVLKLNWEKMKNRNERVLVFLPPFNNAIEEGSTNYRIQELARQLEMPTLAIDHPNVGRSDKLTNKQKEAMKAGDGYIEIARSELRTIQQMGIKEIDIVGQSMGAFTGAEMARVANEFDIKIKNLLLIESPGVEDVSLKEIAQRFLSEGKYLDLYQSAPYDPAMREASGLTSSRVERKWDLLSWGVSIFKHSGVKYTEMMRHKVLANYLKQGLGNNPEMKVTLMNGTISAVSTQEANNQMVEELKEEGCSDRIRHITLPGEPHAVLENARRFAATTKLVLTGSALPFKLPLQSL